MNKTLVHTFSDHIEYRISDTKLREVRAYLNPHHPNTKEHLEAVYRCQAGKYIPITVNVYSDGSIEIKAKNEH